MKIDKYSLILTVLVGAVVGLLPITAKSADLSDLTYSVGTNSTVAITFCDRAASGDLIIPATIEGNPVVRILKDAFSRCDSLTSVSIPSSVTNIGSYAFRYCSALKSVRFLGNAPITGAGSFSTSNAGFVFKTRIGASGFDSGIAGRGVEPQLNIVSSTIDPSGNLMIGTDALNIAGLKVLYSPNVSATFSEVTGVTRQGAGGLTVPAANSALQGTSGFFRIVHE